MRCSLYYISLLLMLLSCDRYIPYPVLADEDALLKLECTAGEADSTMVFVSKKYMITYDHRPSGTGEELLNSSLKFVVNGETLECKEYKGISDKYVVYHQFRAGDRIEVFCSAPGFPDVTASTVIPEAPADIVKDFSYVVEGNILKGELLVDSDQTAGLHLSAALDITEVSHIYYEEDAYVRVHRYSQPLSVNGDGLCVFDYLLPKEYIGPDDEGRIFRETTDTEIIFKLNVLSEELYFAKLHQQSSTMSPNSYTNVKGGLGYVGAVNAITIGTFTSEAQ